MLSIPSTLMNVAVQGEAGKDLSRRELIKLTMLQPAPAGSVLISRGRSEVSILCITVHQKASTQNPQKQDLTTHWPLEVN